MLILRIVVGADQDVDGVASLRHQEVIEREHGVLQFLGHGDASCGQRALRAGNLRIEADETVVMVHGFNSGQIVVVEQFPAAVTARGLGYQQRRRLALVDALHIGSVVCIAEKQCLGGGPVVADAFGRDCLHAIYGHRLLAVGDLVGIFGSFQVLGHDLVFAADVADYGIPHVLGVLAVLILFNRGPGQLDRTLGLGLLGLQLGHVGRNRHADIAADSRGIACAVIVVRSHGI